MWEGVTVTGGSVTTQFLWAASKGHEDVVKLLLEDSLDIDFEDWDGKTPPSRAASNGHGAVVNLLLDTDKVSADSWDQNGWTPLWWAARNEFKTIVKLLLDTGRGRGEYKNMRTIEHYSRGLPKNKDKTGIKLLFYKSKVEVNWNDTGGRTPPSREL